MVYVTRLLINSEAIENYIQHPELLIKLGIDLQNFQVNSIMWIKNLYKNALSKAQCETEIHQQIEKRIAFLTSRNFEFDINEVQKQVEHDYYCYSHHHFYKNGDKLELNDYEKQKIQTKVLQFIQKLKETKLPKNNFIDASELSSIFCIPYCNNDRNQYIKYYNGKKYYANFDEYNQDQRDQDMREYQKLFEKKFPTYSALKTTVSWEY